MKLYAAHVLFWCWILVRSRNCEDVVGLLAALKAVTWVSRGAARSSRSFRLLHLPQGSPRSAAIWRQLYRPRCAHFSVPQQLRALHRVRTRSRLSTICSSSTSMPIRGARSCPRYSRTETHNFEVNGPELLQLAPPRSLSVAQQSGAAEQARAQTPRTAPPPGPEDWTFPQIGAGRSSEFCNNPVRLFRNLQPLARIVE